ncbi:hypothetical protein [Mesorhizobium xinjiangense]|uniref:hypothetical protein n=1 Tax=Mesorhizobium xinjiangense TaxID=2678685 RepID=UPI0012ECC805|nr:hypothetical protein [Mesorhizobium xinjiangense]
MKHQTLDQLKGHAEVLQDGVHRAMTRSEKLQRWAELLESVPGRRLSTLHETEYQVPARRMEMRSDNSPISVAFKDPVLRQQGMTADTYGEAKRFFELSDWQLHDIICYCHFGDSISAESAARHVRAAVSSEHPGMLTRLREAFIG